MYFYESRPIRINNCVSYFKLLSKLKEQNIYYYNFYKVDGDIHYKPLC